MEIYEGLSMSFLGQLWLQGRDAKTHGSALHVSFLSLLDLPPGASCRLSGYSGHRAKRGTKRIGSE
jgi:hypothetical protein